MVASVGTEVVVNHVEDHAEPQRVCPVDEPAHVVRFAIIVMWSEQVHSVVSPAERAGELGDRHDLDHSDPKLDQSV